MFFKKEIPTEKINKHLRHQLQANVGFAYSNMAYLGEYENAIDILFNHVVEGKHNLDVIAHPFFYLIRHSLELGLKHNIQYLEKYSRVSSAAKLMKSHDVPQLLLEFKTQFDVLDKKYTFDPVIRGQFDDYYTKADALAAQIGKDASTFRYDKDVKGNPLFSSADKKDGLAMKQDYDEAMILLAYTADVIAVYTDYEDLLNLAPEFTEGTGKVYLRIPSYQKNQAADFLSEKYEPINSFIWKDALENEVIKLLEVNNECFLVPVVGL